MRKITRSMFMFALGFASIGPIHAQDYSSISITNDFLDSQRHVFSLPRQDDKFVGVGMVSDERQRGGVTIEQHALRLSRKVDPDLIIDDTDRLRFDSSLFTSSKEQVMLEWHISGSPDDIHIAGVGKVSSPSGKITLLPRDLKEKAGSKPYYYETVTADGKPIRMKSQIYELSLIYTDFNQKRSLNSTVMIDTPV